MSAWFRTRKLSLVLAIAVLGTLFVSTLHIMSFITKIDLKRQHAIYQTSFEFKASQPQAQPRPELTPQPQSQPKPLANVGKKYDVLILSNMNSGSRFTGRLFGFRNDSFYFYEPLWKFAVWDYFHDENMLCSFDSNKAGCRKTSLDEVNRYQLPFPGSAHERLVNDISQNMSVTDLGVKVLKYVYNCNFTSLVNLVDRFVHGKMDLSGPSWKLYTSCMQRRKSKRLCLIELQEVCKKADHRVTKVLRLTSGPLATLLQARPNLKIMQLFRDPRSIIHSRMNSNGYPDLRNPDRLKANIVNLCRKLSYDFTEGRQLMDTFPGRLKFVFYEDIMDNIDLKVRNLYEYAGMTYDKQEVTSLAKVKVNSPVKLEGLQARKDDNANWWRLHVALETVTTVQTLCPKVFNVFKLTRFSDIDQLRNISIPSKANSRLFQV